MNIIMTALLAGLLLLDVPVKPAEPIDPGGACEEACTVEDGDVVCAEKCVQTPNLGHVWIWWGCVTFEVDGDGNVTGLDLGENGGVELCCVNGQDIDVTGGEDSSFEIAGDNNTIDVSGGGEVEVTGDGNTLGTDMDGGSVTVDGSGNSVNNAGDGGQSTDFTSQGGANNCTEGESLNNNWSSEGGGSWVPGV